MFNLSNPQPLTNYRRHMAVTDKSNALERRAFKLPVSQQSRDEELVRRSGCPFAKKYNTMKTLRRSATGLAALLVATGLMGCATTKFVRITSTPDKAQVLLDDRPSGETPYTNTLSFRDAQGSYGVKLKKEGFKDTTDSIAYDPKNKHDYHFTLEKADEVSLELATVEPQKTPEGAKLQLLRRPTLAYLEVIERSPNVAAVTRVTSNEDPNAQVGAPVLSPTEDNLVYELIVLEGTAQYYCNIQKMTVGSFGQTRLTYGKWTDINPAFMPNGKVVVFSSNRTSNNKTLWRVNTDSAGGITRLTSSQAEDFSPSVASNGKLIVYASLPPKAEESQIWTIPVDGNLVTQLREGEFPCVAPDGKRILFSRKDKIGQDRQIWFMSVEGAGETQLTQSTELTDPGKKSSARMASQTPEQDFVQNIQARWSPDGKWIVYASNEGRDSKNRRNFDIWLMTADGSSRTQLTTNGSWDDCPCWDRTGEFIYFRSNRGGAWNIWRLKPILEAK